MSGNKFLVIPIILNLPAGIHRGTWPPNNRNVRFGSKAEILAGSRHVRSSLKRVFVPNSSPAKTVPEFIDYVKGQPGKLIIASPGTGSGPHLAELLFMQMAGIQMTHAPYRGAAPAFTDLIPGRVHCYFGSGELLTYSRSGQVRVLATTGAKRSPAAPDVPAIAESVPGYVVDSWQGVFAPAKTGNQIVQQISRDLAKALAEPTLVEKLQRNAYAVESSAPAELAKFLKTDREKWGAVIRTTGIKID